MAVPLWINYRESTHGVNSNGFSDISNRPSRTIWANFCTEHNKDGTHKADMIDTSSGLIEVGEYTGNETDDRTISLTNTDLYVIAVRIFDIRAGHSWFATKSMVATYDFAFSTEGYLAQDHIQDMGAGYFEIGASTDINETGVEYTYIAYGEQVL